MNDNGATTARCVIDGGLSPRGDVDDACVQRRAVHATPLSRFVGNCLRVSGDDDRPEIDMAIHGDVRSGGFLALLEDELLFLRHGDPCTDAADHVPLRYMLALLIPITATLRPFLAGGGTAPEEVDAMHQAWVKAVLLQVILWSHPYVVDGDF